jgi:hypothetical protein
MFAVERHTFGGLGFFDVGGGRDAMITDKRLYNRKGCFVLAEPNFGRKVISFAACGKEDVTSRFISSTVFFIVHFRNV